MAGRFRCNERTLDAYHDKLIGDVGRKHGVLRIDDGEDWRCRRACIGQRAGCFRVCGTVAWIPDWQ
jgi:hypothetical protein